MSTTGLTEKLTLALNSKNAIKSTLVDRAAIEEAAPFNAYAGAIENIGAEMPDIASWVEYELPVTMNQPGKYTADAEHIFFSNQNSVTTDNAGLWLFNSVTGETKRLYDKSYYWKHFIWLNDTKLLIHTTSDGAGIYDFETETFTIIIEGSINKVTELKNHYILLNSGNVAHTMIIEKDTLNIIDLGNFWGRYAVSYEADDFIIITDGDKPVVIDLTTYETLELSDIPYSAYSMIGVDKNNVLISSTYSSAAQAGLWIYNHAEKRAIKIYETGYYWKHTLVLDNTVLIRSSKNTGLLKYILGESAASMLLETAKICDYNEMAEIKDGALIGYCDGNYIYNKTDGSITLMENWTSTYYYQYYDAGYGIFMGTGNTSTNAYFNKATNVVSNFPYLTFNYKALKTNYGHVLYNVKDGVVVVKHDESTQTTTWKTIGESKQSQVVYSYMLDLDNYYYIWSDSTSLEGNIVRISKTNYDDCAEILTKEHEDKGLKNATVIGDKIYFCGKNIIIYDTSTKTYEIIESQFLGSDQLYLSYEKDTYNNFNFTDLQGIMSMETKQVSTIPFRTFLWRNYTFDLYGVTNINNGQQYQFKHPYEKNTYGFADFNYNPNSNNKVINNTNILTGIYSGAIVVCNKE